MPCNRRPRPGRGERRAAFQPRRFLLLWCLVVFAFFSVSSSKLPSYILPLFPALALLLADALPRIGRKALLGHLGLVAAIALGCLILAPRVAERADQITPLEMIGAYADWLTAAAALWLAGSLAAIALAWRDRPTAAVLLLAAFSFAAGLVTLLGHENLSRSNSAYHLAMKVKPLLPAGCAVLQYPHVRPNLDLLPRPHRDPGRIPGRDGVRPRTGTGQMAADHP